MRMSSSDITYQGAGNCGDIGMAPSLAQPSKISPRPATEIMLRGGRESISSAIGEVSTALHRLQKCRGITIISSLVFFGSIDPIATMNAPMSLVIPIVPRLFE